MIPLSLSWLTIPLSKVRFALFNDAGKKTFSLQKIRLCLTARYTFYSLAVVLRSISVTAFRAKEYCS